MQNDLSRCNDDYCNLDSTITVPVTAGLGYWLRVGEYFDSRGNSTTGTSKTLYANIIVPSTGAQAFKPSCAAAAGATSLVGNTLSVSFDTTVGVSLDGLNNSTFCQESFLTTIADDYWACWTPTDSGNATVSTCGAAPGTDVSLQVFAGCGCGASRGAEIACDDDSCDGYVNGAINKGSIATFAVQAGSSYMLRLGKLWYDTPQLALPDAAFGVMEFSVATTTTLSTISSAAPPSPAAVSSGSDAESAGNVTLIVAIVVGVVCLLLVVVGVALFMRKRRSREADGHQVPGQTGTYLELQTPSATQSPAAHPTSNSYVNAEGNRMSTPGSPYAVMPFSKDGSVDSTPPPPRYLEISSVPQTSLRAVVASPGLGAGKTGTLPLPTDYSGVPDVRPPTYPGYNEYGSIS